MEPDSPGNEDAAPADESVMPDWLDPAPWAAAAKSATLAQVRQALAAAHPDLDAFAALIAPVADECLEEMANRAQTITQRRFGRTIGLYVPLYLSNYCSGGCAYCGFAADRSQPRRRLSLAELEHELEALKGHGFEDVLLLTGERCPEADFSYLETCVRLAASTLHRVSVEAFAMTEAEYRALADAGCTGVTLYQETYDPATYREAHRWGPKRDYRARLAAADHALSAGIRSFGIGALLGLAEPLQEAIALFQHARYLQRRFWRSGIMISFPRLCPEQGTFKAPLTISDRWLAQLIFAFRITLPDVPLVLSTREHPTFRDGMAGVGICRMSAGSRTSVGGYEDEHRDQARQFDVHDNRSPEAFAAALQARGLEPVFKDWDATLNA